MPTQTPNHVHAEHQMFAQVDAGMQIMHAAASKFPLVYDPADTTTAVRAGRLADEFRTGFEMASTAVHDTPPWRQLSEAAQDLVETTMEGLVHLERAMVTMFVQLDQLHFPLP